MRSTVLSLVVVLGMSVGLEAQDVIIRHDAYIESWKLWLDEQYEIWMKCRKIMAKSNFPSYIDVFCKTLQPEYSKGRELINA